jgi:hypothetical protein
VKEPAKENKPETPDERPTGSLLEFPVFPGGCWPEGMSTRREDLYADDGR